MVSYLFLWDVGSVNSSFFNDMKYSRRPKWSPVPSRSVILLSKFSKAAASGLFTDSLKFSLKKLQISDSYSFYV